MGAAESLWQDIRLAIRVLSKSPGTTALAVASIALGIGLTAGMFSVGDARLLRPLAIDRPGELFEVVSRGADGQWAHLGWPDYEEMRRAGGGMVEMAAYQRRGLLLSAGDEIVMLLASPATPNFFSLLGVRAALGRAAVEPAGALPTVVMGQRLWRERFGSDPHIVGKTIVLNRRSFVAAGVMPAEFTGLARGLVTDVWVGTDAWFDILGNRYERQLRDGQFEFVARLKTGVTPERAAAQLDAAIRGEGRRKPAPPGVPGTILDARFGPKWGANIILGGGLLAALGLVLFVACANVAQLRLAQVETRNVEFGVRMALGASAWRLAGILLVETALISVAGATLGVLLAQELMVKAGEFIAAGDSHIDYGLRLDNRVLLFVLAATLASTFFAGLAPLRHAMRLKVIEVLKSGQGAVGARPSWQKRVLIIGQLAASVAIFGLALLFVVSLSRASAIRPGLNPDTKLLALAVGRGLRIPVELWCEQVSERLAALPGVRGATYARRLPLSDSGGGARVQVEPTGRPPFGVRFNSVGGSYFSLMGTRVAAGRGIDSTDRMGSTPVVVASRHLARQLFGERPAVGEWISVDGVKRQIVGVAEDGPSNDLREEPAPYLYLPFAQQPSSDVTLAVETAGKPSLLAQAVRQELRRFDPGAVIYSSITLEEQMKRELKWDRMMAIAATGLSAVAFLMTTLGLFGVIQYAVNRRSREIGLRVALGARPGEIRKMVLGESLRMAAWGIPIGLALLGAAAWYTRSMVMGVSPLNPFIYVISVVVAAALAVIASWFPARRAARVDPMFALRTE